MSLIFMQARYRIYAVIAFSLLLPLTLMAGAPGQPFNLRSCDKYNPSGTSQKPYFGWYVKDSDANETQTGYQIVVWPRFPVFEGNTNVTWNSGKVNSGSQNYIYFAGKPLLSSTRYYWKVRTWDKDGNVGPYSQPQYFDTGLFVSKDWSGALWIKRDNADPDDYTYYRKKTSLADKSIRRAIGYVSAVHNYELYINGQFITKGSVNHYPQYQYYHAYDVTNALRQGQKNVIAALTHWYGGGQGRAPNARGFIMKIIIEYVDGSKSIIGTDASWKQHQAEYWQTGQTKRNGEGNGYVDKIDSRKDIPGWNQNNFDDNPWLPVLEIGAPPVSPWINDLQPDLTRVIENEIIPAKIVKLGDRRYLIDLGKIYAGMPVINFKGGTSGDMVSMRGGFVLNDDGTMSTSINQSTNMAYYFILNGGSATFKPMVYLGMRYLEVSNSPCELTSSNVKFLMRHFELDPGRSTFTSSNPMLNQVWELMKYSLIAGAQEGFVDTPTREKGSFLGDGWSEAAPALGVMGDRVMNNRVLNEFLTSQDQYWPDGRLNSVYPNVDGKRDIPDYTQSFLVWVWDYYMQTGNKQFLIDNYSRLKKIATYVASYKNPGTGLIHDLAGGGGGYLHGIIDWPEPMRYGYDMKTAERTVINAYAYIDFSIVAKIAGITGNTADSLSFNKQAVDIVHAINSKLINEKGIYHDGLHNDFTPSSHTSQHANMYPMAMGFVPKANEQAVTDEIKRQKMSVGMVTVRYLPIALGEADQGAHLIDLYTNTEWDGWAQCIKKGATVTWESWNADKRNDSMSHPWGAAGLLGFEEYILGIKIIEAQSQLIQIKPLDFGSALNRASGSLPSDRGDISVSWENSRTAYTMNIVLPVNIKAGVFVPKNGAKSTKISVDGRLINGTDAGNYLFVGTIGSGKHIFRRSHNQ